MGDFRIESVKVIPAPGYVLIEVLDNHKTNALLNRKENIFLDNSNENIRLGRVCILSGENGRSYDVVCDDIVMMNKSEVRELELESNMPDKKFAFIEYKNILSKLR